MDKDLETMFPDGIGSDAAKFFDAKEKYDSSNNRIEIRLRIIDHTYSFITALKSLIESIDILNRDQGFLRKVEDDEARNFKRLLTLKFNLEDPDPWTIDLNSLTLSQIRAATPKIFMIQAKDIGYLADENEFLKLTPKEAMEVLGDLRKKLEQLNAKGPYEIVSETREKF